MEYYKDYENTTVNCLYMLPIPMELDHAKRIQTSDNLCATKILTRIYCVQLEMKIIKFINCNTNKDYAIMQLLQHMKDRQQNVIEENCHENS